MHLAFVHDALQQKAQVRSSIYAIETLANISYLQGNAEAYDQLVDEFSVKKKMAGDASSSSSHLRTLLGALSHVVSRLERQHGSLVQAIFDLPWTTMDSAFVKTYTQFIGVLISARPEYLSLVLGKIVVGFTHRASTFHRALQNPSPIDAL